MAFDLAAVLSRLTTRKGPADETIPSQETSDEAYENALARRDALAADIARLKHRLAALKAESARNARWLKKWSRFSGKPVPRMVPPEPKPAGRPLTPGGELVAQEVRRLIEDRGAPMSREDLMTALSKEGIIVEGANPEMILTKIIGRGTTGIVFLKRFGYWIGDQDFTPAGYSAADPAHADEA